MEIEDIEYHKQKEFNYCGPTLACMALSKFGIKSTQEEIANVIMKHNGQGLENSFTHDICGYITKHGVYSLYYNNLPKEKSLDIVIDNVEKGNPVFVSQRYSKKKNTPHARLVIGFQPSKKNLKFIVLHDPLDGPNQKMKIDEFLDLWDARDSSMMASSNELVIFTNEKSVIDNKCPNCDKEMLGTQINFYENPSGFWYVNKDTVVDWKGLQYFCKSCKITTSFFQD